jgi:dephospho-CoA kinase
MLVGLTGGVGSGKSTVAALLAERGAVVIDADAVAREVVEPGRPAYEAIVSWLGPSIVRDDGWLDRSALAARVFNSDRDRERLNSIVHPAVGARVTELLAAAPHDAVVVYDVPLLVESDMAGAFEVVVVVQASLETRLSRLEGRGMGRDDALARMAAQATDEQRAAVADELIENDGSLEDLTVAVDGVWERLQFRQ